MSVIVLAKNLTFVGANGQSWATDWISVPAGSQNFQLTAVAKSLIAGSDLGYVLQTTWDTDSVVAIGGSSGSMNAIGTNVLGISSGVGPMVRVLFTANANSQIVLSMFLTPKSE